MAPLGSHIVTTYPSFLSFRLYLWLVHTTTHKPNKFHNPHGSLGVPYYQIQGQIKYSTTSETYDPMGLSFRSKFCKDEAQKFSISKNFTFSELILTPIYIFE